MEHKHCATGIPYENSVADRESGSSSEDILSDDSDSNLVNLYDSDVENSVVPVEQSGPRLYQFEPRRVRQNDQQEASPEPDDNNSDLLGNTDGI